MAELGAVPKSSVKIGSPELPPQKPNWAFTFMKKIKVINRRLYLFLNSVIRIN